MMSKKFFTFFIFFLLTAGIYAQDNAIPVEAEDADSIGSDFNIVTEGDVTFITPSTNLVYCTEEIDNKQISNISIPDNIDVSIEKRTVLSDKVITIKGKVDDEEITLIPYYLWSNRGVGKMKVWFPRKNK